MTISPTFNRTFKCPCCSNSFTTVNVRISYPKTAEISSDYCVTYKDEANSPYLYYVNVCDSCGYAYTKNSVPLTSLTKETIIKEISVKWKPRSYGNIRSIEEAIICYKLAIYCSTLKKEKYYLLAGLLLRVGWLYRKMNDLKEEERFLLQALEYYKKSYDIADYAGTDMSEIRILYLIGELSRRCNFYEQAVTYFSKIVSHPNAHFEKGVVDKAREQWRLTRENNKTLEKAI
ncbi:DUF2225 domain-containing protein [Gottfriedia luciferensis]|uniref:DUF2225 domain-containing protein n=1 Tax=Gottfriedia luciferensis TaxID=178774 RepID=UPI00130273DA|nr:DUF2225 domain-containing protein [Gottfriedia luciferensis]